MNFRISAWAIRNPIPVALMFIALTIAGLVAYPKLLVKHFPNIAFPAVMVTVTQNGAAPSEVENQISRPVENAIAGITNVKHVQTTATLGASSTMIEFELGSEGDRRCAHRYRPHPAATATDHRPAPGAAAGHRFRAHPDLRRLVR
jgi:HAE1 family hydrophobic/amphiphilic exporter-1